MNIESRIELALFFTFMGMWCLGHVATAWWPIIGVPSGFLFYYFFLKNV